MARFEELKMHQMHFKCTSRGKARRERERRGTHAREVGFPLAHEMILQVKQFRPQGTVKYKCVKGFTPEA